MRKALYILADLQDDDVAWLARTGIYRTVDAGTVLIRQDEPIETLYIVIDGRLDVTVGAGTRVAELAAGDIVGEMSMIEKRPPSATVKALAPTKVLAIPQDAVRARLAGDEGFAARFYRALAVFLSDRLRSTVSQLGYGNPAQDGSPEVRPENELDEGLLDTLHVAGDRMRRLIRTLEGGAP